MYVHTFVFYVTLSQVIFNKFKYLEIQYSLAPGMSGYLGLPPLAITNLAAEMTSSLPLLLVCCKFSMGCLNIVKLHVLIWVQYTPLTLIIKYKKR